MKIQGKPVYGRFNFDAVPMPTARDFLIGVQRFEEWWRDEFSKTTSPAAMSPTACVNTILMHLSRFLRLKKGIIEFNKRKIIAAYLDNEPPFIDKKVFCLVEACLASRNLTEADIELLRNYMGQLRSKMNACLGIIV